MAEENQETQDQITAMLSAQEGIESDGSAVAVEDSLAEAEPDSNADPSAETSPVEDLARVLDVPDQATQDDPQEQKQKQEQEQEQSEVQPDDQAEEKTEQSPVEHSGQDLEPGAATVEEPAMTAEERNAVLTQQLERVSTLLIAAQQPQQGQPSQQPLVLDPAAQQAAQQQAAQQAQFNQQPAAQQQQVAPPAPPAPMVDEGRLNRIMDGNAGELNTLLAEVQQRATSDTMAQLDQVLPGIMNHLVQQQVAQQVAQQASRMTFYEANPDLKAIPRFVQIVAGELAIENPGWTPEKLMAELPAKVRKSAARIATQGAMAPGQQVAPKPVMAAPASRKVPTQKKLEGEKGEIDAMMKVQHLLG